MLNFSQKKHKKSFTLFLVITAFLSPFIKADKPNWVHKETNKRITGNQRIKSISYPRHKSPLAVHKKKSIPKKLPRKKIETSRVKSKLKKFTRLNVTNPDNIFATLIDSPPLDGFVPWITVSVTDEREDELDTIFEATAQTSVVGNYLDNVNPQSDYAIGILDTGASIHLIGYYDSGTLGILTHTPDLLTSNTVPISGVTGSVDVLVTEPLGLFVDGLGALNPATLLLDNSSMFGQSNVSVAVGQDPVGIPDLVTVIGSPLAVYFATVFSNDHQVIIIKDNEKYTAPDIILYEKSDPSLPAYTNIIPLELRPLGGVSVQYIPTLDISGLVFEPLSPSTIIGNFSQSLFFVPSVDLFEGQNSAIDKDRFLLDTGAQVTVVGSRIAARLALDIYNPEFEVTIEGVTGQNTIVPGFYIDAIDIPALGEWLSFTNVPVILLDIASPEGGTLDGIIGMNLFVDFNLVLKGGGLFLQDDPTLEFESIDYHNVADIAPEAGDDVIDSLDLHTFRQAWLSEPPSANWNPVCDMAPHPIRDGKADFLDFTVLLQHWRIQQNP